MVSAGHLEADSQTFLFSICGHEMLGYRLWQEHIAEGALWQVEEGWSQSESLSAPETSLLVLLCAWRLQTVQGSTQ